MTRLDDPEVVRREYESEAGLRARASVYKGLSEPNALDAAFEAVRRARPGRVLEVGCGWGDFAAWIAADVGAEVVAIDISPRMVELARERGVDALVGDVQDLPFPDESFDVVVANWMLYHVPDLDRGLAELARVLRPGGRLVATTNGLDHLAELWGLVGRNRRDEPVRFFAENAEGPLSRHFGSIERFDFEGPVTFADRDAVRGYVASSIAHKHLVDAVPRLDGPLVATRRNSIFVAET